MAVPVFIGLAVESAVVAWIAADVLQMGDFNTVGLWAFWGQLAVASIFVVPALVVALVDVWRTGELPGGRS